MNILAERSFPSFFKGYAPKLLKFYSDWLDWTEAPGHAQYILNHLSTEQDIDESVDSYRNHLKVKLLPEFPERLSTDLKLLLKNVLWLYRAKSSRKAYDFMFRVLFNSPATIWHPRDTMLRTSDGRWDVPQYAGIVDDPENEVNIDWLIENCLGWRMTGRDSRAESFISAATSGYSGTIECLASSIKKLARVAFYADYGTKDQDLLKKLGTIECDPSLTAFRITNPNVQPVVESDSEEEEVEEPKTATAVWTFNRVERTAIFPPGTSVVEIGTHAFRDPEGIILGDFEEYDLVNLEALLNGRWLPVEVAYSNGMLTGQVKEDENSEGRNAFIIAIEVDGDNASIAFNQFLPLARKGASSSEKYLCTLYFQTTLTLFYDNAEHFVTKAAPIQLKSAGFNKCYLSAKNLLTKKEDVADGTSKINIHSLIDWNDVATRVVTNVEHAFEEPESNVCMALRYDFKNHAYIASINKVLEHDIKAICTIGSKSFEAVIPAGEKEAIVEVDLKDPIVTVGSRNIYGVLLGTPTAHYIPGEKVRLLDPESGATVEVEPVILWHAEAEGHYTSTRGFLSDINAIQDNHYWQTFSYVVSSNVGIREWRHLVKTLLHPAGLEIFGEYLIEGDLEDGNGIYYLEAQTFLKKSLRFFKRLVELSRQAIVKAELILSSSRLAQRHSITTDLWLHWMQTTGDLREEIKALKLELFNTSDIEERKRLEAEINELESTLSSPWMEDIRDWYDIRPSDIDECLNANSVLLFRNDGTLINPLIVDWVDFSFTDDIDEEFTLRAETVAPHTKSIWGTTLHPLHPMIHGRIAGNEFIVPEDQEPIPFLQMAFVGSTKESSGVLVKTLVIGNEVLRYSDIQNVADHEPALVRETDLQKLARKFLLGQQGSTTHSSTGIIPWSNLTNPDFIYVNTEGGLVFNAQSLVKVPEAWTTVANEYEVDSTTGGTATDRDGNPLVSGQTYTFERNAWNDEQISIVSYSPYDFSYRIWIERLNGKVQCSITAYGVNAPEGLSCPLTNSNIEVAKRKEVQYINENSVVVEKEVYVDDTTTEAICVWHEPCGWNGPSREVYATTTTWNMAFKDPARQSSWFNLTLPEIVDNDHVLCFVNGLLQPKSRINGQTISIDTIEDNSSVVYSSESFEFGELSLEEFILDDDGEMVLNEDGSYATSLVMVSINEADNIPFGETTLNDWLVIDDSMNTLGLGSFTLTGHVLNVVGCSISDSLSFAEIYILAPIEGSRKLQYPWHGWSMENEEGSFVWPFTYDNARNMQYSAHNEFITSVKDAELHPDKEAILPSTHWEVEYRNVSRLLPGFQRSLVISTTVASQKQSETVDRILEFWFDDATSRLRTDFFNNDQWEASANFSSTLMFGSNGLLVDPVLADWGECIPNGEQTPGLPSKWWSRPILAETPVEFGVIENGVLASSKGSFKPERYLAFINGLKIPDDEIEADSLEYRFGPEHEGEEASVFSMGSDWIMENETGTGYFNLKKTDSGWTLTTKSNGSYVQVQQMEDLESIDVGEFIGLSMGRKAGTIWGPHSEDVPCNSDLNAVFEIKGSTELAAGSGDKRRFIDHTFLDIVNVLPESSTNGATPPFRLYSVHNNWLLGIVERIVNVDPRFFMVFIDGRHSPLEAHEWRYIKGTFFVEVEPESSVEVYIGNPYSYLMPDFAKTPYGAPDEAIFNNLRINNVPRHMLTSTLWRMMEVGGMHFDRSLTVETMHSFNMETMEALTSGWRMHIQTAFMEQMGLLSARSLAEFKEMKLAPMAGARILQEVSWRSTIGFFNLGHINAFETIDKRKVVNLSETFDDVAFWGQMDPSAWSGIGFNALSKTGKSSMMAFDSDGSLMDPLNVDYHKKVVNPWSTGTVVEILTPEDIVRMHRGYWPLYEVDPERHSETLPTDSRYRELRDAQFTTVNVDGLTFDIEEHFIKEVQDVHLEESIWIQPRPEGPIPSGRYEDLMEDAGWDEAKPFGLRSGHLLLMDYVANEVETQSGTIVGVSIDAEHPMSRNVQTVLEGGVFVVPLPRIGGELVFVDGVKLKEGSYLKQVIVDGRVVISTSSSIPPESIPSGDNVQFAIEIDDPVWKDNDEHTVAVYWPNADWTESYSSDGNLSEEILNSIQPEWQSFMFETFKEYIQSRFVLFCNGRLVHIDVKAGEIFLDDVPLSDYECQDFELYVVDVSNAACRTAESQFTENEESFLFDNLQRNWFMESHLNSTLWRMKGLPEKSIDLKTVVEASREMEMPVLNGQNGLDISQTFFVANNRDTLDNVFCRGSIPVRQYINPSLYVERVAKITLVGPTDEFDWMVQGENESIEDLDFVAINVAPLNDDGTPTGEEEQILMGLNALDNVVDGKVVFRADYVPESCNFTLYATSRENPEFFYPAERLRNDQWRFFTGHDQRLEFYGVDPEKDIWIVEILDVSMENSIANTDWVFWLEKEFNKKSTLVIDHDGLLEHPDGLEWCNGIHIFPHEGTWTAQAEEAKFPAVVNELTPDNIKKVRIMDLCLDDMVGYDGGISQVADASIESIVGTSERAYITTEWENLANKDYIYWEEGEFRNWIAWLRDDDVFDRHECFVFVNGLKIPDWMWTFEDGETPCIKIPLMEGQQIERIGFVRKDMIYDERIYMDNIRATLLDPDTRVVNEEEYNVPVIVDATWAIWKDRDGFPVWGNPEEVPEDAEVVCIRPDPREGIIWPISRIWKYFNSCTSEGIDIPEYLGHDLSKYVLAWVDGRLVECQFEGTRIFVPGCEEAETVEVYVFELHDGAWIEKFNGVPEPFNLTSFRDMRVC